MSHWDYLQDLQEELSSSSEHGKPEEDGVAEVGSKADHDDQSSEPCWGSENSGMLVGQ